VLPVAMKISLSLSWTTGCRYHNRREQRAVILVGKCPELFGVGLGVAVGGGVGVAVGAGVAVGFGVVVATAVVVVPSVVVLLVVRPVGIGRGCWICRGFTALSTGLVDGSVVSETVVVSDGMVSLSQWPQTSMLSDVDGVGRGSYRTDCPTERRPAGRRSAEGRCQQSRDDRQPMPAHCVHEERPVCLMLLPTLSLPFSVD
jgi:hypothetical protein